VQSSSSPVRSVGRFPHKCNLKNVSVAQVTEIRFSKRETGLWVETRSRPGCTPTGRTVGDRLLPSENRAAARERQ
jgi:hypothetical protein